MKSLRSVAVLAGLCALTPTLSAYDESMDGDLSTDPLAPTPLSFSLGLNSVTGSVVAAADTRDYFTFDIVPGQLLTGIFLADYTDLDVGGNGNRGFIHIDDGTSSVIPSAGTSSDFLGGSHLDRLIFPTATDNVLTTLSGAPQGGTGFAAPLGPGSYTINVQQTGPQTTGYTLDFEVIPEPTTAALVGLGALALSLRLRRR